MSAISDTQIAHAIYLSLKDKEPAETHKVHKQIINFLARKKLMSRASAILLKLQKVINQENKIVAAKVHSGHKLGEKVEKDLVHFLKNRYSADHAEIDEKLDKNLLGGYKIEVEDEVIDLSIRNKISKL